MWDGKEEKMRKSSEDKDEEKKKIKNTPQENKHTTEIKEKIQ